MEAMASRAHSCRQLGSSVSLPLNWTGPVPSRGDVSCVRSTSSVSVTPVRLYTEDQQRLVLVNCRPQGMKCAVVASWPDLSISPQSDVEVGAERPKRIGRFAASIKNNHYCHHVCHCQRTDQETTPGEAATDDAEETRGIQIAIAALKFYKREISPLLPGSCRYVPTCSEYSMQAYRTYGVWKGTILTAWRIARCNPLGGSGFDPPRWFGESKPPPL